MLSYSCFFVLSVLTLCIRSMVVYSWSPTPRRISTLGSSSPSNLEEARKTNNGIQTFMVAPVHPEAGTANTNNGNKKNNNNNNSNNKKGNNSGANNVRPSNNKPSGGGNRNSNSNSPFHKMPHKQVLQKIQELQRKDRNGDKLSQHDCDNVLALCVASDEWDSVLEVLDIFKRQNLTQERTSYRACLQACFEVGNGASAKEILIAMEKALVIPEPSDIALTVVAMCRNNLEQRGYWRKAVSLIQKQTTTSAIVLRGNNDKAVIPVQAYDAVLECMKEEREWKEAVRFLRMMEAGSANAAATPKDNSTKNVKNIVKTHPAPELSTYRAVIECCVTTNQPEQAVQVLFSMKDRGVTPSTYTFELIISALSKRLQWRRALQLLETMQTMKIPRTVVTYNSVISACARAREVGMAKNLLSRMRKEGIRPNEVSFNSVIGACASTARWKDALDLLDQCYREPGVTPNIYIYTNAMRACAKGRNTKRALNLLQVVKDKGLKPDCYCYTAVIDACAKAGMWKKALSLLREMKSKGIEPTEVTYSVTISACGNGGQWQKALELLELMREKGMSINLITYNAAITALSKAARQRNNRNNNNNSSNHNNNNHNDKRKQLNQKMETEDDDLWYRALLLLKQMRDDGIEPDGFCYSSAISCLGAQGRWKEALDIIVSMRKGGPRTRPNKIAYTAAINACGRAGEAKHALELFQNMKDEGLSADRVAYNALFSALRVVGDADKTFELWEEICGTRPTSTAAIATAKHVASPDIITVTDCVATLVRAERMPEADQVFREAVKRGIILRGNKLDSQWETDLSGMSFPVARAACRYVLSQCLELEPDEAMQDVTFITGVGRAQQRRKETDSSTTAASTKHPSLSDKDPTTSLRDYVQEVLEIDFSPALRSEVPRFAQGTVVVGKESIVQWSEKENR